MLRHRRDEAMLRLMLESGIRAGEVVALQMADIDLAGGVATVTRGKGGSHHDDCDDGGLHAGEHGASDGTLAPLHGGGGRLVHRVAMRGNASRFGTPRVFSDGFPPCRPNKGFHMRISIVSLALLTSIGVLSGCGGDDSASPSEKAADTSSEVSPGEVNEDVVVEDGALTTVQGPGFAIGLPGAARESVTSAETVTGVADSYNYSVEAEAALYAVQYLDFPVDAPDADEATGLEVLVNALGGEVLDVEEGDVEGYPALDATVSTSGGGTSFARIVSIGTDLLLISVQVLEESAEPPVEFGEVVDSLQIG